IERLEKAFTQLIKRHEIFRTTIEMKNDKPVQIIHDHADFHITQIEGFESEVEQIINEFIRPFNFNNAPYFRVGLIRLEEQKHILILTSNLRSLYTTQNLSHFPITHLT
ncbi:condensation domain-containing protein, partial [Bacillus sp. ABP14]|uniref:condensation domain-containing protein n=1 Tax=Bacillus sp. ABP14 TaxID=1892404 RepID=UPI0021080167